MNKKSRWESKLKVGSDIIDNQHKVLFDLIKDLNNAIRAGVSIKVVDVLLGVLRDYAFNHFQTEEEHLVKHADYTSHCLEHYALIKRLNTFIHEFRNNRTQGEQTPSDFLEHWLFEHIEKFDKPCLANESTKEFLSIKIDSVDAFDSIDVPDPINTPDPIRAFDSSLKEKRQHKRIPIGDVVDEKIHVHCYNATKLRGGTAEIVNLSTGGLMLSSARAHEIDDLLIVSCNIGRTFKMKEKVKVLSAHDQMYGVQFISPASETLVFFTELYGSVHMNKSSYIESQ